MYISTRFWVLAQPKAGFSVFGEKNQTKKKKLLKKYVFAIGSQLPKADQLS